MSNKDGQYQSCLGAASEIDRQELPYAILGVKDNGVMLEMCINEDKVMLMFVEALCGVIGRRSIEAPGAAFPTDGMTTHERHLVMGVSMVVAAVVATLEGQPKTLLCTLLNRITSELSVSSLDELVARVQKNGVMPA